MRAGEEHRVSTTAHGSVPLDPRARPSIAGAALAEGLGTFLLLFFGVGAILAVDGAAGAPEKAAIALAFGFAILAGAYTFGHVSGAHLNPAVTLAQAASGRTPWNAVAPYVVAQLAGAALGVLAVDAVSPNDVGLSVTHPGTDIGVGQALIAEFVLTFALMLVVKGTAVDDRSEGPASGMAIGLTIAAGHLAMIPVSGASFNPARSFGSALVAGDFADFWIYVLAPIAGAVVAALLYERILTRVAEPED